MNGADHTVVFVECMGAKGGQEMLLYPIAEKQGLFLQHSRPGLISTVLLTDFIYLFIYFCIGGRRYCSPHCHAQGNRNL